MRMHCNLAVAHQFLGIDIASNQKIIAPAHMGIVGYA